MAVFLFTDRRLKRNRLLCYLQDLTYFFKRELHLFGNLFGSRLSTMFLDKVSGRPYQLIDRFNHMNGNTNCSGLISYGPCYGLPYPPGGICTELIPSLIFKFLNSLHQTDITFLNQIKKLKPSVGIFFGNTYNQPEICLNKFFFGEF